MRKALFAAAATAAAVALAGCSSTKSSSGGSAAPAAPGAPGAAPSAPAISGTQLTGTQLAAASLTSSDIPKAGFSSANSPVTDSGGKLTTSKAKFDLSTMSCDDQQSDLGEAGFGETAMFSNGLLSAADKEVLSQTVYQFADAITAKDFYTTLEARWNSCGTFSITGQGNKGKLTVTVRTAKSGVGQQDFSNTMTGNDNNVSVALASTVALDGPDVLLVGIDRINGTVVPTDIDTGSMLAKLIDKVAAAS